VRLEGVDAPELHYAPCSELADPPATRRPGVRYRTAAEKRRYLELNERYRQRRAETAAVRLAGLLRELGPGPIRCSVESRGETPHRIFDCYGRLVGRVLVGRRCLNDWLLDEGLAVPAFYTSIDRRRIRALQARAEQARSRRRGIWAAGGYTNVIGSLDRRLLYRPPSGEPAFARGDDAGRLIVPKLARSRPGP
jgi:endonuclease YncB( thermonuclease family)